MMKRPPPAKTGSSARTITLVARLSGECIAARLQPDPLSDDFREGFEGLGDAAAGTRLQGQRGCEKLIFRKLDPDRQVA